ncbi:mannitol dehydrogenase family protein [Arachnia propionica]|uniref:Mannitol dehydrogenase family protein n=1 Tax=Arachnia propionica TaxID=1750 RepID=A0A3P1T9C5_9ACTN|nr:mannitol dehydrogenase family protein [Arachnia propionica]RRD06047.1 mannitol dehydrogenase family protein [Arachnia propionica]
MTELTRDTHGRPAGPIRMVHLGLGNFTRAHQAWYTEHASDRDRWGIAAFTGRRPTVAEWLTPQDGLYTLITKRADGDGFEVISSISRVHPADDLEALVRYLADPDVTVVTSTVTEAGYWRRPDGGLDVSAVPVATDLEVLATALTGGVDPARLGSLTLGTAPVRLLAGLVARATADAGAITILPCDNLPDNGPSFARVVTDAAAVAAPDVLPWLAENVSWATCMVDRITPATTDAEITAVQTTQGYLDRAPVPTEPFSEWVISGDFPAGRPDWESAGAMIVDDVEPYEQRKLWLLNGSHTLLAYTGPLLGVTTVAEAIAHPRLRDLVHSWWEEAAPGLRVPHEEYTRALVSRYENPNIRHLLAQIAADGSQKLPVRIMPTVRAWRERGQLPRAAVTALAAWLLHLRGHGAPLKDSAEPEVRALVGGSFVEDAARVLGWLAPDLRNDRELVETIAHTAEALVADQP